MRARLILREKTTAGGDITEVVVWNIPVSINYPEGVRYRLAFIMEGSQSPDVIYDNHCPKGHHKHINGIESPYWFRGVDQLIADFEKDKAIWKSKRGAMS